MKTEGHCLPFLLHCRDNFAFASLVAVHTCSVKHSAFAKPKNFRSQHSHTLETRISLFPRLSWPEMNRSLRWSRSPASPFLLLRRRGDLLNPTPILQQHPNISQSLVIRSRLAVLSGQFGPIGLVFVSYHCSKLPVSRRARARTCARVHDECIGSWRVHLSVIHVAQKRFLRSLMSDDSHVDLPLSRESWA
jgi:hypothetical protein